MLYTLESLRTMESETLFWETLIAAYDAMHEHEGGAANLHISDLINTSENWYLKDLGTEVLRRMKSAEPPKTEVVDPSQLKEGDKFYSQPGILCIATRSNDILGDKSLVGVVIEDPTNKLAGFRFIVGMPVERIVVEKSKRRTWAEADGTGP